MEQKFVVKTPSCATKVSDHSSVSLFVSHIRCKVFLLDLPREVELFLRLSCAVAPTLRMLCSIYAVSSDTLRSVSFGLEGSILHVQVPASKAIDVVT